MIASESRAGRRIVGRLDRGASLTDAILELCRARGVRSGEIRAVGSLESVEVAEYDQSAKSWKPGRTFAGGLELLSLLGNVSEQGGDLVLNLRATLMRERDSGVEVVGGPVRRGRVFAVEVVIDAFDDLVLRRTLDAATGLALWADAPPVEAAAPTWADVARASESRPSPVMPEADDESEAEDSLEPGDILIHPTFGRCEVQRIEGGYEFAQVRLKNGRLVRLSLDILKVVRAGTEGGHRVFRARLDD